MTKEEFLKKVHNLEEEWEKFISRDIRKYYSLCEGGFKDDKIVCSNLFASSRYARYVDEYITVESVDEILERIRGYGYYEIAYHDKSKSRWYTFGYLYLPF